MNYAECVVVLNNDNHIPTIQKQLESLREVDYKDYIDSFPQLQKLIKFRELQQSNVIFASLPVCSSDICFSDFICPYSKGALSELEKPIALFSPNGGFLGIYEFEMLKMGYQSSSSRTVIDQNGQSVIFSSLSSLLSNTKRIIKDHDE
jgi:hypothetical protein